MAAHEHLAAGQFHRREGRPNKTEHSASDEEESSAPRKPHVRVHKSHPPAKRVHHG
jgi:hypothetical protein